MPLPPILAAEAAGKAQKALTGDIYTRRWTEVQGRGKKAKLIENEVRVNPVGIGLGVLALGAAAGAAALALWVAQLRVMPVKELQYDTYIDSPAVPAVEAYTEEFHEWVLEFVSDISIPSGLPPPDLPGSHAGVGTGGITPI